MTNQPPDFVMVGGQSNVKVYLLASTDLTDIELRAEVEELQPTRYHRDLGDLRHFITAEMKTWVQVVADSYPEAFRILFEQWTPEHQQRSVDGGDAPELLAP